MTANRSLANRKACEAAGMDHVVVKPVDFELLALTIDELDKLRGAGPGASPSTQ